jgi:hypothetical protein
MPSRILRLWNPDTSAWEEVGDSRLTVHQAAADPHPGYVLESLLDAKGDLLAASAADTAGRLPLGTNGQVLTADSTQALGVKWAAAGGGGAFVDEAGDTMSGTLAFAGAAVDSGGAIRVAGPGTAATDANVYGASTPALNPTVLMGTTDEIGVRFSATPAQYLVAVRWYRDAAGVTTPSAVRLWDSTSTATPVWSMGSPAAWADTAVGWKEHRLAAGTQPLLVAGRTYALSLTTGNVTAPRGTAAYIPVPDAGVTFVDFCFTATEGTYPGSASTVGTHLDPGLRPDLAATGAAGSGAVRLPTGTAGAIAWRNAGNTADLPLTVDGSNQLTFNGVPLAAGSFLPLAGGTLTGDLVLSEATPTLSLKLTADTQPRSRLTDTALGFGPGGTTAPDATLSRTGPGALRVDTHLGVGVTPAPWATRSALQVGQAGSLSADTTGLTTVVASNTYWDGANKAITTGAGALFVLTAGALYVYTAPSAAAGAALTMTERMRLAETGTLTLSPAGGQAAMSVGGTIFPPADNTYNLGLPAPNRWSTVYAANGTIQTSSQEFKEGITPLDPALALEAVRATPAVTFTYTAPEKPPEWYDLPDDPEQAQQLLEQRLRAAPLEEAARQQAGFVAEDAHDLFLVGEGQTSPGNSVGVLLAAMQALDARVTALEGA